MGYQAGYYDAMQKAMELPEEEIDRLNEE